MMSPCKKNQKSLTMDDVMAFMQSQTKPLSKRELNRAFGVHGDDRVVMKGIIKELKKKGAIHTAQKNKKMVSSDILPERAVVEITGNDSMGDLIARPMEWMAQTPPPQIVITQDKLSPPAHIGDVVQAHLTPKGNNLYYGIALRRVTMGDNRMVGVFENGQVFSVDRRLTQAFSVTGIPTTVQLKNRDLILVDIPMIRVAHPQATFIQKIGTADQAYASTLISIYLHHLPVAFMEQTEKQAKHLTVPKLDKNRVDLRSIPFVTIDGADAKDFDDAVWAEPDTDKNNKKGWHIMVAIADVAWYVRSDTALDSDARLRGNSTYFPDRVLPMLPVELSNGVCSLNPNEVRAGMVCEIWINQNGVKLRHTFHRALIQSVRRLTYDEVQDAMDEKMPIVGLEKEIDALKGAYHALTIQRKKRGVLEIDVPERQVILNKKGQVTEIRERIQTPSMQLIEELMILANVSAAETLEEKGAPVMYRVHDQPAAEKVEYLSQSLRALGQKAMLPDNPTPQDFNDILLKTDSLSCDRAVNEMVLRSQSQACYSPDNIGHFGLALSRYAHFTSPIRRYADIMVHRALIRALKLGEGALTAEEEKTFADIAQHISYTERQSASAEMDANDRYMALYLADKVGCSFWGRITSIISSGLFVTIEPMGADGFIPLKYLTSDYYEWDEEHLTMVGRSTGKKYTLGDRVRVMLKECVPVTGGLLFSVIGNTKKLSRK